MRHEVTLAGEEVTLVPLGGEHAAALAGLVDAEMWAGMTVPLPAGEAGMAALVRAAHEDPTRQAFAVLGTAGGEVRGSTSLYEHVPAQQRIEIGFTYYARTWWAGRTNPAAKLLLFRHAFTTLGCYRVALRCDARNARSIAAIRRLGAVEEGRLRGHRVAADGSRADTVYFSVLAPEWPTVEAGLSARLGRTGGAGG